MLLTWSLQCSTLSLKDTLLQIQIITLTISNMYNSYSENYNIIDEQKYVYINV